jgi:hypothetical protein
MLLTLGYVAHADGNPLLPVLRPRFFSFLLTTDLTLRQFDLGFG